MRLALRPQAVLGLLCLFIAAAAGPLRADLAGEVAAENAGHNPKTEPDSRSRSPGESDPVLAAFLGAIPLASGYYLTSAPAKGLAFTVADAVLIGSIWNIRRDEVLPDRDVSPYFVLLGAVNLADAVLSLWQARKDESARIRVTLNPSGEPVVGLAWNF